VEGRRAPLLIMAEDAAPSIAVPAAYIEFIIGVPEPCVPDVSLTRSRDGSSGIATFTFDNPTFLQASTEALGETTGMYLKDSEGTMKSTDVNATFTNGKPRIVKGVMVMKGEDEWDRFMRFMERYAEANGLGFSKA
jgi:photosystem II protein